MIVLTINAGSSSIRLTVFAPEPAGMRACAAQRHTNWAPARPPRCCATLSSDI